MTTILNKTFAPFLSRDVLEARISELASQISSDYQGQCPVFVVVLNGAFIFASDLIKKISIECEVTFIRLSSYTQTTSSGKVREIIGLEEKLADRPVIIIEDIVDTGLTMAMLVAQIRDKNPSSIQIATLLHKPEALQTKVDMRYIGFEIDNKFVVGYGLDYDGLGRNLDEIYVLASEA